MTKIKEILKFRFECPPLQAVLLIWILVTIFINSVKSISVEKDLSMTMSEKRILDKFRKQVSQLLYKDYMKTDIYLVRWLRATKFNVNDAERMLKENLKWRRDNKIDTVHSEDFSDMWQDLPASVDNHDKKGRPVATVEIYYWDIRQAVLTGRGPRAFRYLVMITDNMLMQVFEQQQKGLNVTQWTTLFNAEGFNLIRHGCPACIPYWIQYVNMLQNYYPGFVHEFIVTEASLPVNTLLNNIRPFLNQELFSTFRIFSDKKQGIEYLDQRISKEERRAAFGGTKPPLKRD